MKAVTTVLLVAVLMAGFSHEPVTGSSEACISCTLSHCLDCYPHCRVEGYEDACSVCVNVMNKDCLKCRKYCSV